MEAQTQPEKKKSKKKVIIIVLLVLLSLCCVVCATFSYFAYKSINETATQIAADQQKKLQDEKTVKVDPTTNEPISTEESAYENFEVGNSVRLNNEMVVRVVSVEEFNYDNSFEGYEDPFKGIYYIFKIEMINISDKKLYSPSVSLYDSGSGVSDKIGTKIKLDIPDFPLYSQVDPGKKVSGFVQFRKVEGMDKGSLFIQIENGVLSNDKSVSIRVFSIN